MTALSDQVRVAVLEDCANSIKILLLSHVQITTLKEMKADVLSIAQIAGRINQPVANTGVRIKKLFKAGYIHRKRTGIDKRNGAEFVYWLTDTTIEGLGL